jgi:hypothetical protein
MTTLDNVIAAAAQGSKASQPSADQNAGSNAQASAQANQAVNEAAVQAAVNAAITNTRIQAAEIITLACAAGCPAMAASLIRDGATLEHAKARIDGAKEITTVVASAAAIYSSIDAKTLTAQFIAAGATVEHVKAKMFETISQIQAATPQVASRHQSEAKPEGAIDGQKAKANFADIAAELNGKGKKKAA